MGRFRLQKVLEARRILADRRQQELATALRTLVREKQLLQALESERETYRRQALQVRPGRFDRHGEESLRTWIDRLSKAVHRQSQAVGRCEQRVAERRAALVAAMVEHKAIDNLRQRHHLRERRAQEALEQRQTDEMARTAHVRRTSAGTRSRHETNQRGSGT